MSLINKPLYDPVRELRVVRWWLYFVAFLVAAIVLVGGATRLTDSGLSITEWAPVRGIIPPLSIGQWEAELAKYRTTTEYQTINKGMTMDQFKLIFWWEWGHRFLARLIGFVVAIPLLYFWIKGRLVDWLKPALLLLLAMGGLQGFIGWWMVKSGLVDRVDVSQIRLAVHLTMACVIFTFTIWLARSIAPHSPDSAPEFKGPAGFLVLLILAQTFMGGLVAGLDAGMAFNSWPLMNGAFVPEGLLAIQPAWKNFFDNATTVQFVHRLTAYILWALVLYHAISLQRARPHSHHARRGWMIFALVSVQALLGILTLVMQVPMGWALAHQLGAVILLGFATAHWRGLAPRDHGSSHDGITPVHPVYGSI